MFLFQISDYDSPALDAEVAKLFQQRLEAYSRRTLPFMWRVTDKLNAYAAKENGREVPCGRYRIYGMILLVLGIFALVPGLMEPRTPSLIFAGAFAILIGLLECSLVRARKLPRIPTSCQKEAKELLAGRRAVDWSKITTKVCFDETGMTVSDEKKREAISYEKITGIFETENLWLLICDGETGVLLKKKDLISGDAAAFSPYLHHRISENGT